MPRGLSGLLIGVICTALAAARERPVPQGRIDPVLRVVDLNVGEQTEVTLSDGTPVAVKLLELTEIRDPVRDAVRTASVTVEVDGETVRLETGLYNLPVRVGKVQIDCTVTSGYNVNGTPEFWGLDKDARLRLWPADSPLVLPGTFVYPVNQKWFASATWFDNEPVDGGASILKKIYYHAGLDIGGAEGLVDVLAATDGLVVSAGLQILDEHRQDTPVSPRYDVVYVLDARGWYYRYSHLQSIDEHVVPGRLLAMGERIGVLGKEGASGGWSHLHFEIKSRQPSGKWGTQAGYALIREAYLREYAPPILACARPRQFITAGETTVLDGSRSWSAAGDIVSYEWTLTDGTTATGARVTRHYPRPGRYSEVLKVTDAKGHVDYDFAVVQVLDPEKPGEYAPSLHAAYAPSLHVRPDEPVTFKVRAFRIDGGEEIWDFGDGSPPARTKSDGGVVPLNKEGYAVTVHRYRKPGDYIVRVERFADDGTPAIEHLHVRVSDPSP